MGLGEQVGEQGVLQQQGDAVAVHRRPGQEHPGEVPLPALQKLLEAGEVVPVEVGQQEPPLHGGLIPGGDGLQPGVQGHVPLPQLLTDAAAVHHQQAAVAAAQHHALPIFHVQQFQPLQGRSSFPV